MVIAAETGTSPASTNRRMEEVPNGAFASAVTDNAACVSVPPPRTWADNPVALNRAPLRPASRLPFTVTVTVAPCWREFGETEPTAGDVPTDTTPELTTYGMPRRPHVTEPLISPAGTARS